MWATRQSTKRVGRMRDVQAIKMGDGLIAVVGAADQDPEEVGPDDGCAPHDVGRDPGVPVAFLVPRQQVAGQAESRRQEQKGQAEPPVELARRRYAPAHTTWSRWNGKSTISVCAAKWWTPRMNHPIHSCSLM